MSQGTLNSIISTTSGVTLRGLLTGFDSAVRTTHSGSSRPSYATGGTIWLDTTGTPWIIKMYDGADDIVIGYVNATTNLFQPSYSATPWNYIICNGRLTLTSGVPVTTADVTGATNIYFTPYMGNQIWLFNGTIWAPYTFTERTLALGTLTSGTPYDVFIYDNAGTLTLEALAWTNDTTRATALALTDGVLRMNGNATKRYLGTFYTTATTTTEDSAAKRFVWNMYNRKRRSMCAIETTNTWTYTLAAFRQANANTANQLDYVCGLAEDAVDADVRVIMNSASTNAYYVGIGVDSTTAIPAAGAGYTGSFAAGAGSVQTSASYRGVPGVGRHFLAWLEYSDVGGTTTWLGDNNTPTRLQSGILGTVFA